MASSADSIVLYAVHNSVGIITLNAPKTRNALSSPMLKGIYAAITRADSDESVRVIVLTGSGKGFCAGADLKAGTISDTDSPGERVYDMLMTEYNDMITSIMTCKKLVIGAINGAAAGAGCSLALACDFRVMANDAYLLQAFVHIGVVPDAGSTFFLTRQIGYSRALEIAVEGKPIPAAQAKELGLTNKVVAPEQLVSAAREWATELAAKPNFTLAMTKKAMLFALTHSLPESIEYESRLQQFCLGSEDSMAGILGFLQGSRKTKFDGAAPQVPRGLFAKL